MAEYLENEGERGADIVAACRGVPILVEVILEAESQRMLNALMGACVGVLPARKVVLYSYSRVPKRLSRSTSGSPLRF